MVGCYTAATGTGSFRSLPGCGSGLTARVPCRVFLGKGPFGAECDGVEVTNVIFDAGWGRGSCPPDSRCDGFVLYPVACRRRAGRTSTVTLITHGAAV